MRQSGKVALCGAVSSLSVVVMVVTWFHVTTYVMPALAGLFLCVIALELNGRWAFFSYITVSLIAFFVAETEAKILFILFFGYYPALKISLEKFQKGVLRSKFVQTLLKCAAFNLAVIIAYVILSGLFRFRLGEIKPLGKATSYVLLSLGNAVFFLYDRGIGNLIPFYLHRLHPVVRKIIR